MSDQSTNASAASIEETRAYIADMAEQLARMASDLGDAQAVALLRGVVDAYGTRPHNYARPSRGCDATARRR